MTFYLKVSEAPLFFVAKTKRTRSKLKIKLILERELFQGFSDRCRFRASKELNRYIFKFFKNISIHVGTAHKFTREKSGCAHETQIWWAS